MPTRVLLKSKLRLSEQQETELLLHCMKRRVAIRQEMGFMDGGNGPGYGSPMYNFAGRCYTGWALKRAEASSQYENDFEFRRFAGNKRFNTLFRHFNESVNVPKRAINVYKARAAEALVNTSPFTGFMPEGQDDDSDAIKLAERVFHRKLEDSESRYNFREAIRQACISEAVVKTALIPVDGDSNIDDEAKIWLDAFGNPMKDSRGGFAFSDEQLDPSPDILGAQVLRRDPSVVIGNTAILSEPQPMVRSDPTTYKLDIRPVGWENFFCSILEADIHTADCCFHEFDEDLDSLLNRIQGVSLNQSAKQWIKSLKDSNQRYPQAEGNQPVWHRGERDPELYGPVKVRICEQWIRFNVMDRGQADELCVAWAVAGNGNEAWPIYYDLMKNASPTGKRPFEVIRVIPVKDRWYGFGFYDLLSNEHAFIDDAWTRIRARSSASGRLDYVRKDSFEGLNYGNPVSLSTGRLWVLKSGVPDGPIGNHIGSVAFPEMDDKIWEMLKMALQNAQLISGTMTAGDAAMSNMPANDTATGQDLLANESELMSNDSTQEVIKGIVATLKQAIVAVFENYDTEEGNMLLGADNGTKLQAWLEVNKPRQFSAHVRLLLTKARSKQALQAATQANQLITGGLSWVQIVQQFPDWADQLQPFFVDMLNALDQSNADKIIKPPAAFQQQALAQQQAQMATPTQLPVKQTGSDAIGQLKAA